MIHIGISGRDLAKTTFWLAEDPFIPGAHIEDLTVEQARLLASRILHVVDLIENSSSYRKSQEANSR
jgi:hypothetical protein